VFFLVYLPQKPNFKSFFWQFRGLLFILPTGKKSGLKMAQYFFYFLATLTLFCAIMVVVSRNPIHSVLYGVLTFFTLTGHYIVLNAQFLAAVNVIVYSGAIMVLFVFTIMFLNLRTDTEPPKPLLSKLGAVLAGGILLTVLLGAIRKTELVVRNENVEKNQIGLVESLGKVLFEEFLLPFELASVLFLVAIVGAILLANKEKRFASQATLVSTDKLEEEMKKLETPHKMRLNE
jgi:NADH-quinone oxidoreductase subunit J